MNDRSPTEALHARAAELDAADPLARWRDEFHIADPDLAYLDGNSLGMPPRRTLDRVDAVMHDQWGRDLIRSWDHWVDLPRQVGDLLAPLIGARAGEVIVHDSTTVNLYQLVRAALRSMIDYRTAESADITAETRRARDAGALVVWDLSHAAGLHPVGLRDAGAELAVGCTYKFLNGGPGSPAFSYVADALIDQIDEPFHGWFARTDQFAMGPDFVPRDDIARLLVGTPGILGLVGAQCGIEVTAEAGIDAIRAKSIELGRFGLRCCDALGLTTSTPTDDARRGGHLCVHHHDARTVTRRLADEHHVLADFREPDVIRLGCSPLTTRFADVARATAAIAHLTA